MTNDEILLKWRSMTKGIITAVKAREIEALVLGLDSLDDVTKLTKAMNFEAKNPLSAGNELDTGAESGQQRAVKAVL